MEEKKLGKYAIQSELGRGSMGIVYKSFDTILERTVALKTIRKELIEQQDQEDMLARFKREAQAAGRLNHPNIVAVYEYDEDGETAFISMEFVQGRKLSDFFLKDERFDIKEIARIMSQILGALSYAHHNGVVHRDIKPENILLTNEDRQVKITDFGIAHIESSNLTQAGTVMGTPSYMSPEQFMGHKVDGRSDIFSAGVIFYQFITGENPFIGRSMQTIMYKILNENPVNPSALNLHISPALNEVAKKAISKRADERFQTAEEFFEAIQLAINNNKINCLSETAKPDATAEYKRTTKKAGTQKSEQVDTENDFENTLVLSSKISEKKSEDESYPENRTTTSERRVKEETDDNGNLEKTFIIPPSPKDSKDHPVKKNRIRFLLVGSMILLVLFFSGWQLFFSKPEKKEKPQKQVTSETENKPSDKTDKVVEPVAKPSAKSEASPISEISVKIKTDPQNAAAFLKKIDKEMSLDEILEQGESKGETPLELSLKSGIYELTLKKDGYYDFATELEIETGAEDISFEAKLIKTE